MYYQLVFAHPNNQHITHQNANRKKQNTDGVNYYMPHIVTGSKIALTSNKNNYLLDISQSDVYVTTNVLHQRDAALELPVAADHKFEQRFHTGHIICNTNTLLIVNMETSKLKQSSSTPNKRDTKSDESLLAVDLGIKSSALACITRVTDQCQTQYRCAEPTRTPAQQFQVTSSSRSDR